MRTGGNGWQADVRGLVQASTSSGSCGLDVGWKEKLMVLVAVASMTNVGNVRRTLSLIAIREQPWCWVCCGMEYKLDLRSGT